MLLGEAKLRITRMNGDQGSPNQLARAGDAVVDAIRYWDTKHDWAFRLSLSVPFTLASGANTLTIPGIKRVYSARTVTPAERYLEFKPRRQVDVETINLDTNGDVVVYTLIPGIPDPTIKFWRTPIRDTTGLLDYHTFIPQPASDDDVIQVPEEYLIPLLDAAKYFFIRDRLQDDQRIAAYRQTAMYSMAEAIRRDRKHPDLRERFTSVAESGRVLGRDPNIWEIY